MGFSDSDIISLYLEELYWLTSSIKTNTEKIFQDAKVPEKGYVIQVNPEIHSLIKSVIDEAAQLKNMLMPRERIGGESEEERRFRKERGALLTSLFNSIDVYEILRDDVRNAMEHFDERLDRLSFTVRKNKWKKDQFIAYNLVISDRTVYSKFPNPIRIYVSTEKKFYLFGLVLDLGKIRDESGKMLEILNKDPRKNKNLDPDGLLLRIPKQTKP